MEQHAGIRVASYNVRKCVGLDRRRVPERVLDVISDIEADVVAIQEADMRLGHRPTAIPQEFIGNYTDMMSVDLAANDVSLGWHGNAVLVRKGTEITFAKRLNLPHFEPRGAALVELEHKGRQFRIVATHLGLMRRHRQLQLKAIAAQLAARAEMPTIILGDFNEWSRTDGLEPLQDSFDIHTPGRSYHAARPVAALDRIATSYPIALKDAGVHEKGAALKASDHLPVWADLAIA